jgi:hypothetical protein
MIQGGQFAGHVFRCNEIFAVAIWTGCQRSTNSFLPPPDPFFFAAFLVQPRRQICVADTIRVISADPNSDQDNDC